MKSPSKFIRVFSIIFLSAIFFLPLISSIEITQDYSSTSTVQIKSLKYEPYPVNPGEYFDFWVSVQYNGNPGSNGIVFELIPSYPFSLDPNESAVKNYGVVNSPSIILKYKLRVDEDAIEGTNQLKLNYKVGSNWYAKIFDIEVANAQTNFDAVIQESSSSGVSIAIANTGKNAANSVIVKIPHQESFEVTGTDGQMVGNLASGDYTIVSFDISQRRNAAANFSKPDISLKGEALPQLPQQQIPSSSTNFKFDIYYTDNIGERRVVSMELPVSLNANSSAMFSGGNFGGNKRGGFSWSIWYTIIIVLVLIAILFFLQKKYKLISNLKSRLTSLRKKKSSDKVIPDWIKKVKEKN